MSTLSTLEQERLTNLDILSIAFETNNQSINYDNTIDGSLLTKARKIKGSRKYDNVFI